MSRLDEIKARAEQVHWTSTSIEQATARMASSAADVPWLLSTVECLTDLCGEFRKREERLNAEVERLRGWIDRSERQEARARRAEAEVARLTAERDAVIERLERVIDQWRKTGRAVISEMNRADKAEAERDALAAQVARVEKLAEEWSTELDENRCPAHAFPGCDCHEGYHHAWDDLRAALGAMGANQ